MISALYILSNKGDVLIRRIFRNDVTHAVADAFRIHVVTARTVRSPIKQLGATALFHIRHNNVWLMVATKENTNAAVVFEVLHKTANLLSLAFDGTFDEEAVRGNYVLVYELIDEILDHGYPQTTGEELFKLYITQRGGRLSKSELRRQQETGRATAQVTGAIPWRSPDLRYKRNEIFIDVIENVNVLISNTGQLLHADVSGQIQMKTYLSGMPECRFGMNDKLAVEQDAKATALKKGRGIAIDDCTFHQCVRLHKYDTDRVISFIPPDGEFILMRYRTTENITAPFRVIPIVNETNTRVEVKVTVKSLFSAKLWANDVVLLVPTPKNTAVCRTQATTGRAKYEPSQNAIVWRIKRFPGDMEYTLSGEMELLSTNKLDKKQWSRPPISMQFAVPMFTASGLHVRFLKVVEPKLHYQTIKWVRYVCQAGSYLYRI